MSQIGPSLPPHLLKKTNDDDNKDHSTESEDDSYGPALPPHLKKNVSQSDLFPM